MNGKALFPEAATPEEIIYSLAEGDIIKMKVLKNTKVSEVKKLMITCSKVKFLEWLNEPEPPAETGVAG